MTQSSNLGAVPTSSGGTVRGNFNIADQALATDSEGTSAPSPTYPFMRWRNNTAKLLYQRNAANNGWEIIQNYGAVTDPGTGDDAADGYIRGSLWINTSASKLWWCADPTTGAAVWVPLNISPFMQTVLDDADAPTPRTTRPIPCPASATGSSTAISTSGSAAPRCRRAAASATSPTAGTSAATARPTPRRSRRLPSARRRCRMSPVTWYNTHWLVARHGHRTPAQIRADQQSVIDLAA